MKISTTLAILPLATLGLACADAPKFGPQALKAFHTTILRSSGNQAIDPSIVRSDNKLVTEYGAVLNAARWPQPTIPVCWENRGAAKPEEIDWVRDSIAKTWEKESGLAFTNWGDCGAGEFAGIRILISDEGPHTEGLGRFLRGRKHGMILNFAFRNWSPSCQLADKHENCVRSIAVHEFGHAVGFTHEQNRADAPGECRGKEQGTPPDRMLTPYDPDSVMNYCNKKWNNDGFLSKLDIEAVRTIYGPPTGGAGHAL